MKLGTIKIGKEKWTIVLANKERGFTDDEADAVCAYDTKTIYIARRLGVKQRSSALLHEILHVVLPEATESTVLRLESALFPLLYNKGWRPFNKKSSNNVKSLGDDKSKKPTPKCRRVKSDRSNK